MFRATRSQVVFIAVGFATLICPARGDAAAREPQLQPFSVHITSPLGRTGVEGAIRIVAQVRQLPGSPCGQVRFFVDNQLLRSVEAPPYAVEWVDENPFEPREIAVEAVDTVGNVARDKIVLEPFEVTEAAEVTSVLLDASVQDKSGRFVRGMTASSFTVLEDGVPQSLDLVSQEAVGATLALLVDASASMSRRMDFVRQTAATLSGELRPLDRMILAPFSRQLGAVTGPTKDRTTIIQGIQAIKPDGGTAILDSLVETARLLKGAEGRRAIILITDGYDEHSSTSFADALAAVKSSGATVYVVGIGGVAGISIKGERLLRKLAVETGGRFFFPTRDQELSEVHDVLTGDVQNRYLISYTPQNQRIDGSWRAVQVLTSLPQYVVRTRAGYFAPQPPPIKPAVEFTAVDESGRYLNLTIDDVEILEDGVPQHVDTFQEAVQPVSIVLALDASGSMRKKESEVIESARDFIGALRPQDELAVVLFADQSAIVQDLSKDRAGLDVALQKYRATGGTALYDALWDCLTRLKTAGGRRVVVVMTDGRDENNAGTAAGSVRRLDDIVKYVQDTGTLVFGIGLGSKVDSAPLQQLADVSGGRAFFPADVRDLPDEYHRVVDDLRRRYLVGYTSSHHERDGRWRKVEIRLTSTEEADVRTPGGYFAPSR